MRLSVRSVLCAAALLAPTVFAGHGVNTLVVVGDSLSAGYQNNQLIDCFKPSDLGSPYCFSKPNGQRFGYANVIARQAGVDLKLPLIPPPGFPQIVNTGGFDVANTFNFVPREDGGLTQTLDLSVPGYTVAGLFYPVACPPSPNPMAPPLPIQIMAAEILSPQNCNSGITEIGEAAALTQAIHNDTTIFWIGSNDALFPLLFAGQNPTPEAAFETAYDPAVATLAQTSKRLVLANIPDVTLLPYLTPEPVFAAYVASLNLPDPLTATVLTGLMPGDMVTPYAFAVVSLMKANTIPFAPVSMVPPAAVNGAAIVIPASEVASIQSAIAGYNNHIAKMAAKYHAALVDIHGVVNNIAANGITINGKTLTTAFMGGLFSLDGVHPSNTGYAIIANEFIRAMRDQIHTSIPPADLDDVAANDPMVFVPIPDKEKHEEHVTPGMADGLRQLMKPQH